MGVLKENKELAEQMGTLKEIKGLAEQFLACDRNCSSCMFFNYNQKQSCGDNLADMIVRKIPHYEDEWHDVIAHPDDMPADGDVCEVVLKNKSGEEWIAQATYSNKILPTGNVKGFGFDPTKYKVDFTFDTIVKYRKLEVSNES